MDFCWIGVGSSYPSAVSAARSRGSSESEVKADVGAGLGGVGGGGVGMGPILHPDAMAIGDSVVTPIPLDGPNQQKF